MSRHGYSDHLTRSNSETVWQIGPFRRTRIYAAGRLYLSRFEFVSNRFSLKLHKFTAGDNTSALHDHPWRWFYTLPINRGYCERVERPDEPTETYYRFVKPGRIHRRDGSMRHAVIMCEGGPVWTVILCGPLRHPDRSWFFYPVGDNARLTGEKIHYQKWHGR